MTALATAEASVKEKAEMADKLARFAEQLCAQSLPAERARPAQAVLSGAFIEWAIADNPGLIDFKDLLIATESCLVDYDMRIHRYYTEHASRGGPRGQVVEVTLRALGGRGEAAVASAAKDAYETLLRYMVAQGVLKKPGGPVQ